ncbi:MAG: hypothetical protein AB7I36_08325 [Rhodospirillaceae bacterium]
MMFVNGEVCLCAAKRVFSARSAAFRRFLGGLFCALAAAVFRQAFVIPQNRLEGLEGSGGLGVQTLQTL